MAIEEWRPVSATGGDQGVNHSGHLPHKNRRSQRTYAVVFGASPPKWACHRVWHRPLPSGCQTPVDSWPASSFWRGLYLKKNATDVSSPKWILNFYTVIRVTSWHLHENNSDPFRYCYMTRLLTASSTILIMLHLGDTIFVSIAPHWNSEDIRVSQCCCQSIAWFTGLWLSKERSPLQIRT
jgi:hypothetical protein